MTPTGCGVCRQERAQKKEAKEKKAALPKKPRSSFLLFCGETRGAVLEEQPHLASKITEVSKVLGEKWAALDEEGKKVWETKVEEDKARFVSECEAVGVDPKDVVPSWGAPAAPLLRRRGSTRRRPCGLPLAARPYRIPAPSA